MSPRSVLPGRIRFESPLLVGLRDCSRRFERQLSAIQGVFDASVNHRTGRILVRFDESVLSREALEARAMEGFLDCTSCPSCEIFQRNGLSGGQEPNAQCESQENMPGRFLSSDLFLDALAHVILPSPLDHIVPSAVGLWRRGSGECRGWVEGGVQRDLS